MPGDRWLAETGREHAVVKMEATVRARRAG
jgi:hypothetical protein